MDRRSHLAGRCGSCLSSDDHTGWLPQYEMDGVVHDADFGIVAYGKLGGIELGYNSDLDIIFIHNSRGQRQQTNGKKTMENSVFFARMAQKIIHVLTTFTHDGRLYEIDTRLRPSGQSGLLVTGIDALTQYQQDKAWVWEHQALLRSRMISGSADLQERFDTMRRDILCQSRDYASLLAEVSGMREKMLESLGSKDPAVFNLKKDRGGITDIEFMVQFLILAHAHQYPQLVVWSDNIRQLEALKLQGVLVASTTDELAEIYRTLRNRVHALALQEEKAFVDADAFEDERRSVRQHWKALMQ